MSQGQGRDAVERFVDFAGHRIAVVDGTAGRTGPPLVLLHGYAMSARLWPALLPGTPLDDCRWISVSLPGHFPSTVPSGFGRDDVEPGLFVECVTAAVRSAFSDAPAHLVGWSTGGFSVVATAARRPEVAASVVSLSGFARGRWGHLLGTMQKMAPSGVRRRLLDWGMQRVAGHRWLFDRFLQALAGRRLSDQPPVPAALDIAFEDYRRHDPGVLAELLVGLSRVDLTPELKDVVAPTLVLGGARDRVIPPSEAEYLHRGIAGSELIQQAGVGHIFFAEALEETVAHIWNWIETHS